MKLISGDCLEKLKELPENSVDSVVTDPPYELGFMGKGWDKTGIANNIDLWKECLRVLKPGGHLLSFGGTRTYHRMAVAIEDAGFEVRDMVEWCYGSGFPKSLNIGKAVDKIQGNKRETVRKYDVPDIRGDAYGTMNDKQDGSYKNITVLETKGTSEWEGWGTALKPAHEPICLARKPLSEKSVAENVLKWKTGGINIDISRIPAYIDGDNNENIVLLHKLSELRHKLYILLFSCVADKKDCPTPASDVECVEMWKKLVDCLGDCSPYSRLYDGLSHLFLKGGQVSVQQLHDALGDIDRLRKEQSSSLSSPHTDHLSSLDDFYQLILSYLNDTPLHIKSQVKYRTGGIWKTGGTKTPIKDTSLGRFPANLIHDNSEEVRECFPDTKSGGGNKGNVKDGTEMFGSGKAFDTPKVEADSGNASRFFKSIIYQAKASKSERNKGPDCYLTVKYNGGICKEENMEVVALLKKATYDTEIVSFSIDESGDSITAQCHKDSLSTILTGINEIIELKTLNSLRHFITNGFIQDVNSEVKIGINPAENVESLSKYLHNITKGNLESARGVSRVVLEVLLRIKEKENWQPKTNFHATVKPIVLMEYLIKMVTPKGGTVLDPFAGSGSTLIAAKKNGFKYIGIEKEPEYIKIAEARINATRLDSRQSLGL